MVKVEMQRDKDKQVVSILFEASDDESLDTLDAVRVAVMTDLPKRADYLSSRKLVVQVKENN